ncbi:MAG: glycosyltransferase [Ferroplasma sp.]|uniref:glycosyltransferase family 4 protein n=1 Tax=Ferroplasma sp. TaxID=2591003 RepID=UPI002814C4AC|nr:glycosyltransferase [Ferroplasma sp.]WMT50607.1 MAG: glycosyltransferase [Ferroplasma sp.]
MVEDGDLDYLFLVWGIPIRNSPGAVNKQIYSIANRLAEDNKTVGILYISYNSVAAKYNIEKNSLNFRIKLLVSRITYTRFVSKIPLYFFKKSKGKNLSDRVKLYASGTDLPLLKPKHIVTSYWWAVLLAAQKYSREIIYFILYHDYTEDIRHSNMENVPLLQQAYKMSNLILANRDLASKIGKDYPVITEGIDIKEFLCKGSVNSKKEDILLIPLRKNPLKGIEYAIPALNMIHEQFPQVEIVGYGDFDGKVPNFIDFKHIMPDKMLIEYFCNSTYFILPSITEGIPEPLLEAMAGGCACISTASGGPQQVISNEVNGMLVPVKDPESIFTAFKKLYNESNLRRSIMEHAIRSAGNYDLGRTYNDFIKAIKFYENNH